jgi:lysyl-tRNA synthetase class II
MLKHYATKTNSIAPADATTQGSHDGNKSMKTLQMITNKGRNTHANRSLATHELKAFLNDHSFTELTEQSIHTV